MNIKRIKFIKNISQVKLRGFTSVKSSGAGTAERRYLAGFTLLEVLIAASIFGVIMLITTGTVAQSSSYRNKLKTLREVNEETRRIADQITRDVRLASKPVKVSAIAPPAAAAVDRDFKNGLALLKCGPANCLFVDAITGPIDNGDPFGSPNLVANTLIISTKDGNKIYSISNDNRSVYFSSSTASPIAYADIAAILNDPSKKINSANTETAINFGGYSPDDSVTTNIQQPYVHFFVSSRTKDFDNLPVTEKSMAELRSTVTSRSYNN